MTDHEYGLESCVFTAFKEETGQLEAIIDQSRILMKRMEKLTQLEAKRLKQEKGNPSRASKQPSEKQK